MKPHTLVLEVDTSSERLPERRLDLFSGLMLTLIGLQMGRIPVQRPQLQIDYTNSYSPRLIQTLLSMCDIALRVCPDPSIYASQLSRDTFRGNYQIEEHKPPTVRRLKLDFIQSNTLR